jgi:HSP20 family molecular chaperone IbpA
MSNRNATSWIWNEALDMLERAERLQRQFGPLQSTGRAAPSWVPPVDVFEQGEQLVVLVALPGVPPQGVEVLVDGAMLVVRGTCPLPQVCREAQIRRLEIPYGRFERRVELPAGLFQPLRQDFQDGCLVLVLGRGKPGGES